MKFYRNGSVRSRGIDVLVSTGSRFFKLEVDTKKHKNYRFLEPDNNADYKNIFCI